MKENINYLSHRPVKLKSTRAWRTYTGGKLIEEWQGCKDAKDSEFPEEWIASVVKARNPGREHVLNEGLSEVELEDGKIYTLKDIIEAEPAAFLGRGHVERYGANLGVLGKILDSAERLTIQVHPDNSAAQRLFDSAFGKTEAWYILGGRKIEGEEPYILFGFKPGVTKEMWQYLFQKQNIQGMIEALNKFYIKPGEVYLIEGGVPHSIGPGCFLFEIQEPTDYTIRVERTTPKGRPVPDASCHQELGFDKMFECFHYEGYTEEEILKKWRLRPVLIRECKGFREYALITYENTTKFAMNLLEIDGAVHLEKKDMFSVVVVLSGKGILRWKEGTSDIRQGEQVFLPVGVEEVECICEDNKTLKLIRCFPPE